MPLENATSPAITTSTFLRSSRTVFLLYNTYAPVAPTKRAPKTNPKQPKRARRVCSQEDEQESASFSVSNPEMHQGSVGARNMNARPRVTLNGRTREADVGKDARTANAPEMICTVQHT